MMFSELKTLLKNNNLKKKKRTKPGFKCQGFSYSNWSEYQLKLPAGLAATSCRALEGRIRWAEGGAGATLDQSADMGVVVRDAGVPK